MYIFPELEPVRRIHPPRKPPTGAVANAILKNIKRNGIGTDRQIKTRMGYNDMNNVRPQITRMIDQGYLKTFNHTKCEVTGKFVRVVVAA